MRKRDIQIDYAMLEKLRSDLKIYRTEIKNIETVLRRIEAAIESNNEAASIRNVMKRFKKAEKRLKECENETIAIDNILNGYVHDMSAIVKPLEGMTRVSRNDIYCNITDMRSAMSVLQTLRYTFPFLPEDENACEEDEKIKMSRNYYVLQVEIGDRILSPLAGKMEAYNDKLGDYYEKVKDYDNMDDTYSRKMMKDRAEYSSPWELFKQYKMDEAKVERRIIKGILVPVNDLANAVRTVQDMLYSVQSNKIALEVAKIGYLYGTDHEKLENDLGAVKDYFGDIADIIMHPKETLESLADKLNKTIETEGLEYVVSIAVTNILLAKATETAFTKKTSKYADDVIDAVDDTKRNAKLKRVTDASDKIDDATKIRKGGSDAIIKNGKISIDDLKTNPSIFSGKSVEEIADILRNSGYDVTIKNSTRSRSGAQIIQINNPGGGKNISQVQVSPGGGRHGNNPYVKISTTDQGIIKIIDGIESTYKTDGKETATIIFSGGN